MERSPEPPLDEPVQPCLLNHVRMSDICGFTDIRNIDQFGMWQVFGKVLHPRLDLSFLFSQKLDMVFNSVMSNHIKSGKDYCLIHFHKTRCTAVHVKAIPLKSKRPSPKLVHSEIQLLFVLCLITKVLI